MSDPTASLFTPDVIAAVTRHMNDDHADDAVLICRSLGGRPDTEAATMSGMDEGGIEFLATLPGGEEAVRVPWSGPVTERPQIRAEVARMYHEACAQLGIEPRVAGEH